eukprot:8757715-Pyramimonas_sp.AAC.1
MHLPRTHRIDAAAVSEPLSRGLVQLQYERTQNEAADIGAKRFVDPMAWVKVLYIANIVTPKFWAAKQRQDYLDSAFSDGLPLEPGGFLKPRLGPSSALRREAAISSKKSNKHKKAPQQRQTRRGCPRPSRGGISDNECNQLS